MLRHLHEQVAASDHIGDVSGLDRCMERPPPEDDCAWVQHCNGVGLEQQLGCVTSVTSDRRSSDASSMPPIWLYTNSEDRSTASENIFVEYSPVCTPH